MKKIIATVLAMVMALALCSTAFASTTKVPAYVKYTTKDAKLSGQVELVYTAAANPTVVDDKTTKEGVVAHYTYTTSVDTNYVVVSTLAEADLVAYSDKDGKNVMMYLAEVNPNYLVGEVFANFGDKCGQAKKPADFDASKTYYVAEKNGTDEYYVSATDGAYSLMVSGKLVSAAKIPTPATVGHAAVPTVKDGKITGYTCKTCGAVAIEAPNYMSIPKGADNFTGLWYFPAAAASTTTTTTSSPKTFDAGIAMYVGMALTSVAGSAVVIGKKKEF